eukprot:TRINITY_DN774008_c0_g1_i1.p1 TRINITY_DN774008_c0_g1~~TRINITY_DN774008_c0_g1_i1.p1  ORF type:complete len:303 (-),score=45.42 TRINITY_DN774008_c0_g1_i1:22-930(-)
MSCNEIIPVSNKEHIPIRAKCAKIQCRQASSIMKMLSEKLPLGNGLFHLKRIKSTKADKGPPELDVLLAEQSIWNKVDNGITETLVDMGLHPYDCELPGLHPFSEEECKTLNWPVIFRNLPTLRLPFEFNRLQLDNILSWSSQTIDIGSGSYEKCGEGLIVVDPKTNIEIARVSAVELDDHPLHHSVQLMASKVSKSQQLDEAATKSSSRKRQREKDWKDDSEDSFDSEIQYLCTGYDVYLSQEPCLMCAMALVHSRVSRVFFVNRNPEHGALVSRLKLHLMSDLNHNYSVFEVSLPPSESK